MVCKAFLEVHKEVHVEVLGIMPVIATLWTNLIVGLIAAWVVANTLLHPVCKIQIVSYN